MLCTITYSSFEHSSIDQALLVLKCQPEGSDPIILANASDVSHFGYFQRSSVKEFIVFVGRTVAKRTPPGQRQSVQHEEYKVHAYNRNGLCALGFMDDHYPVRSSFSVLNKVLDEYQKTFGESWRSAQADGSQPWPYLNEALAKFQDPAEADKLMKIQRELDETKIILHKTIDSVLARGEKLDSLVEKSSDLSAASQVVRLVGVRGSRLGRIGYGSPSESSQSEEGLSRGLSGGKGAGSLHDVVRG
uniref:VAMP-like protein YKT61 n=1 Tax=Cannabis sativa TaxID=3483 RepID=A0A803QBE6_CANSA